VILAEPGGLTERGVGEFEPQLLELLELVRFLDLGPRLAFQLGRQRLGEIAE